MKPRTALVACGAVACAVAAYAEIVQVEVKEAKLREQPRSLAKPVADVTLGEKVEVQKKEGGWWNVKPSNKPAGWITKSALASDPTVLKAGQADDAKVSKDEQALAYRPFDQQTEAAFREDNANLAAGYAALDKIDQDPAYKVSDEQVAAFLAEGGLQGGGQ